MKQQELVERLEFLLVSQGWAQLRTGTRRTDAVARTMLRTAAKNTGLAVETSVGEGFIRAEAKG